ncbi:MAG: TlpA family protein disulfide reductase [Bacteroidia bacterium]|nr:TlpA family protein disulfide reductase [Bacteroidia bacterium]
MRFVFLFVSLIMLLSCKKQEEKALDLENENIEVYNFAELEPMLYKDDNRTYVINFWATWCKPCVEEMPYFQAAQDTYGDRDVKVLLVSLDFPDKLESQVIPFIKKNTLTPQVVLLDDPDENTWIPKVDESWSGALPATLIYHKGQRAFYEQSFTKESLFAEINKFVKL